MQVSLFSVAPGDRRALDDLNHCLRGHRVLTLDRHCGENGVWSFCVTWQPGAAAALSAEKAPDGARRRLGNRRSVGR